MYGVLGDAGDYESTAVLQNDVHGYTKTPLGVYVGQEDQRRQAEQQDQQSEGLGGLGALIVLTLLLLPIKIVWWLTARVPYRPVRVVLRTISVVSWLAGVLWLLGH